MFFIVLAILGLLLGGCKDDSTPAATGTLNFSTNTISGTYLGDPGGTWSGSPCN